MMTVLSTPGKKPVTLDDAHLLVEIEGGAGDFETRIRLCDSVALFDRTELLDLARAIVCVLS